MIKLSEYAKKFGVTYQTAFRWYQEGKISNSFKSESGSIFVKQEQDETSNTKIVIYARVSNQTRKKEMDYQAGRIQKFAEGKGYSIDKIYKEVASGMNDSRKQLWKMIESKPKIIFIENKDRLTRFGYEYLCRLLKNQGTEIICVNLNETEEDDLMKDMISIITSFCCRLYGQRRGKNKSIKIEQKLREDDSNE